MRRSLIEVNLHSSFKKLSTNECFTAFTVCQSDEFSKAKKENVPKPKLRYDLSIKAKSGYGVCFLAFLCDFIIQATIR